MITQLTEVQRECLEPGIAGSDIVARSGTGSGKSLAFLLVAVERVLKHGGPAPGEAFPCVVVSPVTDLAQQLMTVARRFLKYHNKTADAVIGGTSEKADIQRLENNAIDVLVATPGRFKSILRQSSRARQRLSRCQTFVIDEADKLTDPGFIRDLRYIHETASNPGMQTLAFSATLEKTALLKTGLLRPDAVYVDAIATTAAVAKKIRQVVVVADVGLHLDVVANVVKEHALVRGHMSGGSLHPLLSAPSVHALSEWSSPSFSGFRVMVFLPSNAFIDYFARVFKTCLPDIKSFTLHGGLQQRQRTRVSDSFRTTDNCVLFTSDASARGVDYPDVSCVIQVGFDSRAEYLQRVGRTGRAGKEGTAFLVIAPEEIPAVNVVCESFTELFVQGPLSDRVVCSMASKLYTPTGFQYPTGHAKLAKDALRGWLGSLASKWKRSGMSASDAVALVQKLSTAMQLGEMDSGRLKSKLHIK